MSGRRRCGLCNACVAKLIAGLCGSLVQMGAPIETVREALNYLAHEDRIWQNLEFVAAAASQAATRILGQQFEQEQKKPS